MPQNLRASERRGAATQSNRPTHRHAHTHIHLCPSQPHEVEREIRALPRDPMTSSVACVCALGLASHQVIQTVPPFSVMRKSAARSVTPRPSRWPSHPRIVSLPNRGAIISCPRAVAPETAHPSPAAQSLSRALAHTRCSRAPHRSSTPLHAPPYAPPPPPYSRRRRRFTHRRW